MRLVALRSVWRTVFWMTLGGIALAAFGVVPWQSVYGVTLAQSALAFALMGNAHKIG